jgi:hypothetical protein
MKITENRWLASRGFGVHSPWAYQLIETVINEKRPYYAYDDLFTFWEGAPQYMPQYPESRDKLLFRLTNHIQPRFILEVGTGAGVSTGYFASVSTKTPIVTIDAKHPAVNLIRNNFKTFKQIDYRIGDVLKEVRQVLDANLQLDLVHIAHTIFYKEVVDMVLPHVNENTLIIVEDMGKKEKKEWWNQIIQDERVGVTFRMKKVGLLFFDLKKNKQHYVI